MGGVGERNRKNNQKIKIKSNTFPRKISVTFCELKKNSVQKIIPFQKKVFKT